MLKSADISRQSDPDLMLAAKSGCTAAFDIIISRYRGRVLRFLLSLHSDVDLAEDVCQEAFARAWMYRGSYAVDTTLSTYLFQIAKHALFNRLRSARPAGCVQQDDFGQCEDTRIEHSPERAALSTSAARDIRTLVHSLPNHLRVVFEAVVLQEMRYTDASQALDVPLGTIKSRMHEATRRLRMMLIKEGLI